MQLVMMDSMWVCDIVLFINITIILVLLLVILFMIARLCAFILYFSAL